MNNQITPNDINTNRNFMGSIFGNSETETVLRNVCLLQKNLSLTEWTPFSWEDYKNFCTHNVGIGEKKVLDALAYGGKPSTFTSAHFVKGWLTVENEKYILSEGLITALYDDFGKE